jgi:hypothetical protein
MGDIGVAESMGVDVGADVEVSGISVGEGKGVGVSLGPQPPKLTSRATTSITRTNRLFRCSLNMLFLLHMDKRIPEPGPLDG